MSKYLVDGKSYLPELTGQVISYMPARESRRVQEVRPSGTPGKVKNKGMQCKDIPTLPVLEFVEKHGGIGCTWFDLPDCPRSVVHAMPPKLPQKLVLAKMRQLISHGLVDGCPCGCRGDYELTDKGERRLRELKEKSCPIPSS